MGQSIQKGTLKTIRRDTFRRRMMGAVFRVYIFLHTLRDTVERMTAAATLGQGLLTTEQTRQNKISLDALDGLVSLPYLPSMKHSLFFIIVEVPYPICDAF